MLIFNWVMYQIKQIPEDFVVKEISSVKIEERGGYGYFRLRKRNRNTLGAVELIAGKMGINQKEIGFGGNKDKKAVTEQVISIRGGRKEKIKELKLKDIELEFLGYGEEPVTLGRLERNYFEIVVRHLDNFNFKTPKKIINYFDEQRFGGNNAEIGRQIVKKNFGQAVKLIDKKELEDYLARKKNDFVGALKLVPRRLLKLYVNAYQSRLWNETVKEALKKREDVKELLLIGFGLRTGEIKNKEIKKIIEKILEKEEITPEDFVIKQIPELSQEGGIRNVFVEVKNFKVLEKDEDELNPGKKKIKVSFSLPKGSYGTLVVKEMLE